MKFSKLQLSENIDDENQESKEQLSVNLKKLFLERTRLGSSIPSEESAILQ